MLSLRIYKNKLMLLYLSIFRLQKKKRKSESAQPSRWSTRRKGAEGSIDANSESESVEILRPVQKKTNG